MFGQIIEGIIVRDKHATSFIILVFFLLTFIVSRTIKYFMDASIIPDFYLFIHQTHIHHLNYGIFLLSIGGYLSLVLRDKKYLNILAIVYGVGLGLTFDEFSLWLFLEDNYYARISYESIVVISAILINVIYFSNLWQKIFTALFKNLMIKELKDYGS